MTDTLTDEKLSEVAEALAVDKNLPMLGLKLGFRQTKVDLYMGINKRNDSFEGTTNMLFDWKKKTPRAEQIPDLVKALGDSSLAAFVDEFFPAGAGDGDPPTPQNSSAKSQQDQDQTTPFPSSPNAITSPSTSTTTGTTAATATTATTTNTPTQKVDNSTSLPSSTVTQEGSLNRMDRIVTEKELLKLAGLLPADSYMDVAIHLGLEYTDYDNIKLQNASLKDANFKMLMKWKRKDDGGKVEDLDKALKEAQCGGLSYKDV